jgi:hypothetical protein
MEQQKDKGKPPQPKPMGQPQAKPAVKGVPPKTPGTQKK